MGRQTQNDCHSARYVPGEGWGHIEAGAQRNPGDAGEEISGRKGRQDVLDRDNMNRSSETLWETVEIWGKKRGGGKTMSPVQMQKGTLVQDCFKLVQ